MDVAFAADGRRVAELCRDLFDGGAKIALGLSGAVEALKFIESHRRENRPGKCANRSENARTGTPPRFGTFIPDVRQPREISAVTRSLEPPNGCNVIGEIPS